MTTSLIVWFLMAWGDKTIMTLRPSTCGLMLRCRKTDFGLFNRYNRLWNRSFFIVCSAVQNTFRPLTAAVAMITSD
jgi:hypothetical protein